MRVLPGASPEARRDVEVLAYREFQSAAFPGIVELLRVFMTHDVGVPVRRCVLACAGQLMGDEVMHDNLPWPIRLSQLRSALAFEDVCVLNDFEALAYALGGARVAGGRLLCGPDSHEGGAVLVAGPGTGLGAAVYLPAPGGARVLPTEAGQIDFAPNSVEEREILARLAPHGGYVPYERVVSGPGLLTVYSVLCSLHGEAPRAATPQAVTAAAEGGTDARAVQAVEIFCATLGSFVGALAMAFMPAGGVYLAGGFLHSMFELLQGSAFEERFLHGRSARAFLSRMPVRVIHPGRHGVIGAAEWYAQRSAARDAQPAAVPSRGFVA